MNRPSLACQLIVCLALAPALGRTEGAVRHFDCVVVKTCDASGSCTEQNGKVTFRMTPVSSTLDGSGRFEIRYATVRAPMQALSDTGPFHWKVGTEHNTLLVTSIQGMLWHQLDVDKAEAASTRFLTCRYQP